MDKFLFDQAEGLRRMLAESQPRIFTFLSATSSQEKSTMLVNLAASLTHVGRSVLVLDASMSHHGVSEHLALMPPATLSQVARREKTLNDAILMTKQGFSLSVLATSGDRKTITQNPKIAQRAEVTLEAISKQADVLIVDATLDENDSLPLVCLAEGEVVVQVSDSAVSIKAAYSIIKRLNAQLGRRPFSILVTGTTEARAQMVYQNMAKVASRYLAVPLTSIGHVPQDEHMARAARLGRTVIDAFPLAGASLAFRKLADSFACSATVPHNSFTMATRGSGYTA